MHRVRCATMLKLDAKYTLFIACSSTDLTIMRLTDTMTVRRLCHEI